MNEFNRFKIHNCIQMEENSYSPKKIIFYDNLIVKLNLDIKMDKDGWIIMGCGIVLFLSSLVQYFFHPQIKF